jgi:hypothetical protein
MGSVVGIGVAAAAFLTPQLRFFGPLEHLLKRGRSWYDHLPFNYTSALTLKDETTMFGDKGRV